MSSNIIIFYDLAANKPNFCWSPNTLKTRYSLNYKGLPFKTVWVEYPDIEPLYLKIGAVPTAKKRDGSPLYTVPLIQDPSTGAVVSDSFLIAEYLDATYPDTPRIIPTGTNVLQRAFLEVFSIAIKGIYPFLLAPTVPYLNPPSAEYFSRTKGFPVYGKPLEEILPKGRAFDPEWKKLVKGFAVVNRIFATGKLEGPFVMGDTISFADFEVAGWVSWMKKVWGEDSSEWKNFEVLHGGRWDALTTAVEKYDLYIDAVA